jgi:hypothetical protein
MTKAEQFELEIRREGLLRKTAQLSDIIDACKVATRCASKHQRLAHDECNGIPKEWDSARKEWIMGLSVGDGARIDKEMKDCRDKAHKALKSILVPGLEYDFRNDHVYCMVRVRDKENRRAFSL